MPAPNCRAAKGFSFLVIKPHFKIPTFFSLLFGRLAETEDWAACFPDIFLPNLANLRLYVVPSLGNTIVHGSRRILRDGNSSSQTNNKGTAMSKNKFVDFKAIKAAITMEQVLEHYGILDKFKRSGDSLSGPCPIHKGSNPTQFRVSISKNVWNCFSECKHGGNVLDFIGRMEGVTIHAAALKAIEWFNLDPEAVSADSGEQPEEQEASAQVQKKPSAAKPAPKPENSAPNKPLKFRLDKLDREHPYLKERGLAHETIVDFGIGFCAKGTMADRIAIPIHNVNGEVMAYAGRFPGGLAEDTP